MSNEFLVALMLAVTHLMFLVALILVVTSFYKINDKSLPVCDTSNIKMSINTLDIQTVIF